METASSFVYHSVPHLPDVLAVGSQTMVSFGTRVRRHLGRARSFCTKSLFGGQSHLVSRLIGLNPEGGLPSGHRCVLTLISSQSQSSLTAPPPKYLHTHSGTVRTTSSHCLGVQFESEHVVISFKNWRDLGWVEYVLILAEIFWKPAKVRLVQN